MEIWHILLYSFAATYAVSTLASLMTAYRRRLLEEQQQRAHPPPADASSSAQTTPLPPGANAAA